MNLFKNWKIRHKTTLGILSILLLLGIGYIYNKNPDISQTQNLGRIVGLFSWIIITYFIINWFVRRKKVKKDGRR